jgi:integrase
MAFQFSGFRATKPIARLKEKNSFEAFFILYDNAGVKHRMRYSNGINKLPPGERKKEAQLTADVLWEALQKGWNPLVNKYPHFIQAVEQAAPLDLEHALDFALMIKKDQLSKFSFYDYAGCVRFIKAAASDTGHIHIEVKKILRKDIRLIMATAKEENEWSSNARNKYLTILKSLFSVLVDEERLEYNPAHSIKNEVCQEGSGYARVTDKEKEAIATHLMDQAPDFFEYLMFIYQSGIRRTELLQVRIRDINLHTRELVIRPEVAKTNRRRTVPITDDLMEILLRREIWSLSPDHFLFSAEGFRPGEKPFHPNTPTSWWRRLVIDGLQINCKMYSLKHKGADDKIKAGIDLDVLRTLYGHRSKQMTEIYARAVREQYAEKIIASSPVFAKVIQLNRKAK